MNKEKKVQKKQRNEKKYELYGANLNKIWRVYMYSSVCLCLP